MSKNIEGITIKKEEDFSEWYTQLIKKSDLADYSNVSGCIVFKPDGYAIWENIQQILDSKLKKLGIKNAYFPLFIPESLLQKESTHVKGFKPEVAWVTHAGNTKLNERLAVRPTSETIMYDSFSKWIRSWRDLPLRLNQWNSVVRWEFKHPVPFLRTREFLWNEGHTAFATKEEAEKEVEQILKLYNDFLNDYLALYGLPGKKTDNEKFAGAEYTLSIELFLPNGKGIQGPDVHHDGQIFSKAFNIKFLDKDEKEKYVWQNTFAITTRIIGILIAIHGDNKGLILPPKISRNKVVIIPIYNKKEKDKILAKSQQIKKKLAKFDAILDDRDEYSPGWKFNQWELKGIPIRLEIGPKDMANNHVVLVSRHNNKKEHVSINSISKKIDELLEKMQDDLLKSAKSFIENSMVQAKSIEDIKKIIENQRIAVIDWCNNIECEDLIKEKTGAKILNLSLIKKDSYSKCICGQPGKEEARIAKSY